MLRVLSPMETNLTTLFVARQVLQSKFYVFCLTVPLLGCVIAHSFFREKVAVKTRFRTGKFIFFEAFKSVFSVVLRDKVRRGEWL